MTNITPRIRLSNGRAVTSTQEIAELFGKRHDNVLRKLESLDCSKTFAALNFEASEYLDSSGRRLPCYKVTKDGFVFLAMGFTGKKAAQFKEAYITAFNEMEAKLNKQQEAFDSLPSINRHQKYRIKRAFSAYVDHLCKSKTQQDIDALVAYLDETASGYTKAKGMECLLGISLDQTVGLIPDDYGVMVSDNGDLKIRPIGQESWKWLQTHLKRKNSGSQSVDRYQPKLL